MNQLVVTAAVGAVCIGVAACGDRGAGDNSATSAGADNAAVTGGSDNATASVAFPRGARIVEENDVFFRIDPDGTRVRLGPEESRIVVEDDVRFRVDPDGTRVRIDPEGAVIDVDLPDVDVGINEKGNPDVDVREPDGR